MSLRPAAEVMTLGRAGAAVPDALSFARLTMREIVRARWKIEKLRFDLDAEGRGEVLYRFSDGRWTFHFFLVALKLAEEQKLDRNWAQSWDAMGVLCQGDWTPEREAILREEVPKQRNGYADYGTLVYARGNRSARFFDHVVDRLAAGEQPDLKLLARVGYILRTTAFIANGQLGTRGYAGLEPDHPFRRPYHVQMASAFLLREYVFDLVDHVARARNPNAVRLDPAFRRYLGIGNAAATGLISFVVNHPHLMHRWNLAHETALAAAMRREPDLEKFRQLLERAIRYHREGVDERTDRFATAAAVAADLEKLKAVGWQGIGRWAAENVGAEACEVLNAIILELHPDLAASALDAFHADERNEIVPGMTAAALRGILQADYGWALADGFGAASGRYFWYRAVPTPRENRRGLRGVAPELQAENGMDTALRVRELWDCLAKTKDETTVAELLHAHPELRHVVARVQGLAGREYAELRVNWLGADFSPFEPIRYVLAFYGMEKFESALPKSVRGSFLQGAPIAEDVAAGRDGDWPLPLIPAAGSHPVALAPLPPAGLGAVKSPLPPPARTSLALAPFELTRTIQTALQGHGAPLGVAEEAAAIVAFAQACGEPALGALLLDFSSGTSFSFRTEKIENILNANRAHALAIAPAALDLACVRGIALVEHATNPRFLGQLALRCAERGLLGAVAWNHGGRIELALAGPGPWYAGAAPHEHGRELIDFVSQHPGRFAVACRQAPAGPAPAFAWNAEELRKRRTAWQQEGVTIGMAELKALERAAAALLVPEARVAALRPDESSDPLKVF